MHTKLCHECGCFPCHPMCPSGEAIFEPDLLSLRSCAEQAILEPDQIEILAQENGFTSDQVVDEMNDIDSMKAKDPKYRRFVEEIINIAKDSAFAIHPAYSGSSMFGKTCLCVAIPSMKNIADIYFHLGWRASEHYMECPIVAIDNTGYKIYIYWPQCEVATH